MAHIFIIEMNKNQIMELHNEARQNLNLAPLIQKAGTHDGTAQGRWGIRLTRKEIEQTVKRIYEEEPETLKAFMNTGNLSDLRYPGSVSDEVIERYLKPLVMSYYGLKQISVASITKLEADDLIEQQWAEIERLQAKINALQS